MNTNLPREKQTLLEHIVGELRVLPHVKAVVLGGSYAIGHATATSDLDVGIYYHNAEPFAIEDVREIAEKYSSDSAPTVTNFYEWGPWVNGGAWIQTAHSKVDFLYKNIEQITATIENAKKGIWENNFDQQPPYGFSSIIFLAETHHCIPLYDPHGIIQKLKQEVAAYPLALQQSVIQQSLWAAEFTLWYAEQSATKRDMYNIMGCLTRAIKHIVTTLFAMNEIYPMGDKRALDILEKARIKPLELQQQIDAILSADKSTVEKNITLARSLWSQTVELTHGVYRPFYNL